MQKRNSVRIHCFPQNKLVPELHIDTSKSQKDFGNELIQNDNSHTDQTVESDFKSQFTTELDSQENNSLRNSKDSQLNIFSIKSNRMLKLTISTETKSVRSRMKSHQLTNNIKQSLTSKKDNIDGVIKEKTMTSKIGIMELLKDKSDNDSKSELNKNLKLSPFILKRQRVRVKRSKFNKSAKYLNKFQKKNNHNKTLTLFMMIINKIKIISSMFKINKEQLELDDIIINSLIILLMKLPKEIPDDLDLEKICKVIFLF